MFPDSIVFSRDNYKTPYTHAFWSPISRIQRSINIAHIEHKCLQSKIVKAICVNKIRWTAKIQQSFIEPKWLSATNRSAGATDFVSPTRGWDPHQQIKGLSGHWSIPRHPCSAKKEMAKGHGFPVVSRSFSGNRLFFLHLACWWSGPRLDDHSRHARV